MAAKSNAAVLSLSLSTGVEIPLRQAVSKSSGNLYWATMATRANGEKYNPGSFGVNVDPKVIGGSLPTWVEFDGKRFPLVKDTSEMTGKVRAHLSPSVDVTVDGEAKSLTFRVSVQDDGGFNIASSINGKSGKGSKRVATSL